MSESPAELLVKVYGIASVARIAGMENDHEGAVEALEARFKDRAARKRVLAELPEASLELLAFMNQIGRHVRGERLKKRWFLHGYEEFDERIDPLIATGVVLVGSLQAREPVSLETALDQGLLQQWIQVTPGFEGLTGDPPPPREVVQEVEDETRVTLSKRLLIVEFNILNCARALERETIRLNRDGSPHRSDLKGLAPLLIDRPVEGQADSAPDPLLVDGWDTISFLLSLGESLGLIERNDGEEVIQAVATRSDYFDKALDERLAILARAVEHQRSWSELDAHRWHQSGEPPLTGEGDGGFLGEDSHGAMLAGPRGSIFAAIRRLQPTGWFDVEETVKTITNLESQYLKSALPIEAGDELSPFAFVRATITLTLPHVGAIELGQGKKGEMRARLTEVGRAMLGMGDAPTDPSGEGCILVEPNFEITAFLDQSPLRLLGDLSRFATLSHTSERVARYQLTGESAQFGYAHGYNAEGIRELLTTYSAQPLPPAVTFALQDWERLHRRVTVFPTGDLVASTERSDPEVIQSGVEFAVQISDEVERIDVVHTFVAGGHTEALQRALDAAHPLIIDYNGPIVPTLEWVDTGHVKAPLGATDYRTLARLFQIAKPEGDETWWIDPAKVQASFPEQDGYLQVIDILREGLVGGLSAERELALKGLLGEPAAGELTKAQLLVLPTNGDGDRVARIKSLEPFIVRRLGPSAYEVDESRLDELRKVLTQLGIQLEED